MPLIPLLPEQVAEAWDRFGGAIARSLPPGSAMTPTALVNILRAVLAEEAVVWALYATEEEAALGNIAALLLTEERLDIAGIRSLFIYAFVSFQTLNKRELWHDGIGVLKRYAASRGCRFVSAY